MAAYSRKTYEHETNRLGWQEESENYCYGASYYGGDLNGVSKAIENYLADLGVDMIYLTPIFKAESNHKYDTLDYKQIDPQFGTSSARMTRIVCCSNWGEMKIYSKWQ